MDISVKKIKAKASRIKVGGSLSVESTAELHKVLLSEIEKGAGVSLDLSNVSDVDAAGLQLLCSAHKTARTSGIELTIEAATDDLWDHVDRSGFVHSRGCSKDFEPCLWSRDNGE